MPSLRQLAQILSAAAPRPAWRRDDVRFVLAYLVAPVGLVLAVFAGLRVFYGNSVEPDEADLILFSQRLSWGYSEQPPLYSWLCEIAFAACGVGPLALTVVRLVNLAAIVSLSYATARLVVPDRRLALLASYSVLLAPSVSWHALTYLTHSNLLFLACLGTLYSYLRLVRDGRTRDYVFLGIACACGVLSKYNFVVFAAALLAGSLTVAPVRRRLLNVRFALTLAVFAALVAPHLFWILNNLDGISDLLKAKVLKVRHPNLTMLGRTLFGWKELLTNCLLTVGPLALLVGWLFRRAVVADDFAALARRVLGRFLLIAVTVMLLQIAVSRTSYFHERWLMPFVAVVPIWLFARLDASAIPAWRIKAFAGLLVALVVSYSVARAVQVAIGLHKTGGLYPLQLDFRDLAKAIEAEAGDHPVVLTPEREVGGNLLLELPHARVRSACTRLFDLQAHDGPVVIAWNPELVFNHPVVPWMMLTRYADTLPPRHIPPDAIRYVQIANGGREGRPAKVAFVVLASRVP